MQNKTTRVLILSLSTLSGCASTPFGDFSMPNSKAYTETRVGQTGRLRVSTDGAVRLANNTTCSKWTDPNSGVGPVARGPLLTHAHNGKTIGMPGDAPAGLVSSEFYVPAGQPLLLHYMKQQGVSYSTVAYCDGLVAFVPEAGKDYQAILRQTPDGARCIRGVVEIGSPAAAIANVSDGKRCSN